MAQSGTRPIRLIDLGQTPSWQTQAYYHAVAEQMEEDTPDTLIICQPTTPYLCLGYHQIHDEVFSAEECERRGLPVYRRRVGGGATYLDQDQLFYQFIFHHTRVPLNFQNVYQQALSGPVRLLERLGLDVQLRAVNEIEVNGDRIAGIGGGRIGQASVVVGNYLFDFDFETMAQVWHAPMQGFRDLAAEALRDRLITINELIEITIDEVKIILIEEISKALGRSIVNGNMTKEELDQAALIHTKIASQEYLALHSEMRNLESPTPLKIAAGVYIHAEKAEINGSSIQASFCVRDGIIQKAVLEQEAGIPLSQFADQLIGVEYKNWQQTVPIQVV